jgi:TonB family protein
MIFRDWRLLLASVALAGTTLSSAAFADSSCRKPEYPPQSLRLEEEGVSLLGFLVRADGTVARSVVLNSSGSANLDTAALDELSKCTFEPGADGDTPAEMWTAVEYVWTIDDDPGRRRLKQQLALATVKGDLNARFHLYLVLWMTAKSDVERQHALVVLRSAAELGQAHAQFALGRRYEKGNGVDADIEEALGWYRKAAAQGDVLAAQRLHMGRLPDRSKVRY